MPTSDDEIRTLERAAFEAWQAEEVSALGPWRLRAMRGVTKRANSVWAGPGEPPGGFTRAIAEAEAWYAARRLPPIFQIAPIADPRLDALLAERGYQAIEPVSFQLASAERVAGLTARPGVHTECASGLTEAWFDLSGRRGRFQGEASAVYRAFLERIAPRAGFATARSGDAALGAVGLTIVAPPLAGVFSMLTLPEQRGLGLAEALLGEIARFALARGAARLYLQVEVDNAPARSLYERAGFVETHRYHYRARSEP